MPCSVRMLELSPSWSIETIALLIDKELVEANPSRNQVVIERESPSSALLTVEDPAVLLQHYHGIAIPKTRGYHHFCFENGDMSEECTETESPPLHLQLLVLSTHDLELRLKDEPIASSPKNKLHYHALLAYKLTQKIGHRNATLMDGIDVGPHTQDLLHHLTTVDWPHRQRKGVRLGHYLTIKAGEIWDLCLPILHRVDPQASCSALAVTKNFWGSPHIDQHDTTFQYVLALGDFEGGRLSCDDEGIVYSFDVGNRMARLEGRRVHWVEGWKGVRYSIVYYSTRSEDFTPLQSQSEHSQWMVERRKRNDETLV